MERRYQILAVAPNHGTARLLEESAETRSDVRMDVFVGSLQRGVEIVQSETEKRRIAQREKKRAGRNKLQ